MCQCCHRPLFIKVSCGHCKEWQEIVIEMCQIGRILKVYGLGFMIDGYTPASDAGFTDSM